MRKLFKICPIQLIIAFELAWGIAEYCAAHDPMNETPFDTISRMNVKFVAFSPAKLVTRFSNSFDVRRGKS